MPKSYKPEVIADSTGQWYGNALRFATREEALDNVRDLEMRWFSVRDTRVVESDDPVNYRWVSGKLVEVDRPDRVTTITVRAARSNEVDPDQKEMPLDDK